MQIYIVVAHYEDGRRDERAFAYHLAARAYAAAQGDEAATEILDVPVVGDLEQPDLAYTLRWNDHCEDTDNIEAVYGNDVHALLAVGRHGRVEQLHIDVSTDAAQAMMTLPDRIERHVVDFRQVMAGMRQNRAQRMRRWA
ncbi:hypothetical protein [Noviherbaspirillum sp. ST9]|uniref:hypothetical protein n=1 Tax=Noviherbaspirillum sp. ST9 TaxID=3401606 RepID=UPI003B58A325